MLTFSCAGAEPLSELPGPAAKNAMSAACTGAQIDLGAVLRGRSCLIDHAEPWVSKDQLETTVALSKATVAPGEKVDVTVTYKNNDSVAQTLLLANTYTAWNGTPHVEAFREWRRAIGESSVLAEGDTRDAITEGYNELKHDMSVDEPGLYTCLGARPRESYSRVVLPPGGVARFTLPWTATRAHATHLAHGRRDFVGCGAVARTPLRAGVYVLGVASPLLVSTGRGVELGQHTMRVEVKN